MPGDRAGYQVSIYAIDVSKSMGEERDDVGGSSSKGSRRTKLSLAQEFVARQCEPKITSGRKTEAVGILSFGGKTNNQANLAYVQSNPHDNDPPYSAVACDVSIQTAKPKMLEAVMNLEPGQHEGNPVSALMVALDMIHVHKHTKSWALEVVLVTDGESAFVQDEYEDAMARFDELGVRLTVVGVGFEPKGVPVDKSKTRNKRLSEKFWRTFISMLHETVSKTTSSEEMLPILTTLEEALKTSRLPRPSTVNSAVSGIELRIGSETENPEEAIIIPIKYSKATMKARPPSLSKAWKAAMDLQAPKNEMLHDRNTSQLIHSLATQTQTQGDKFDPNELAAMISAEVKQHSTYVIKRSAPEAEAATQATQSQRLPSQRQRADSDFVPPPGQGEDTQDGGEEEEVEEEEEYVEKEDIVKAWRFGSTWVPMEADVFEPLNTFKGVEVLGFFPEANIKRHQLIGEVRFLWPDTTSAKAQIQFSSLVEGMKLRAMCAVVRWVLKDQAEPVIGVCVPNMEFLGDEKRLDNMFWVKLPFAEDEHQFWFPSLTIYKNAAGKQITDHPLLPTEEQCQLMDQLVEGMDLDAYAAKVAKREADGEAGDEDEDMDEGAVEAPCWFQTADSLNPTIHRIKEAIFHASLTSDLNEDPLGPPHPELTKYFHTPEEVGEGVESITEQLKEKLNIKKVPAKQRKKYAKEGLRDDEGYIDIDELFDDDDDNKGEPSTQNGQPASDDPTQKSTGTQDKTGPSPARPKAKKGRLISNEQPLEDFRRLIEGEGDVFRKAIQDLGAVVKENIEASFSRQAFPLAIDCLKAMRETALTYEEVETYNAYIEDLEKFIKAPNFKHKDFWDHFEKAGKDVAEITDEEAEAALEA